MNERKKVFLSLKAISGSVCEDLLDHLHEAIHFIDSNLNIKFQNEASEMLTGFSKPEIISKPCHKNILIHHGKQTVPRNAFTHSPGRKK